ncbi:hypothetical protein N1031_06935 [Herbiconiux moechotypicola]|uniref:Major tail protein n=1 Tax=Herbiconiux moechotypicola TaxID=637393 RepID=A0ABN3DG31_9MICO|nr:hypothetical protein [Herbiconiux moechotypicola]MCS5729491.1 hypothetical protein [Herbiconiux moechotypicola]
MTGDAKNTAVWQGADVFISFDLDAEGPTDLTTPWDSDWSPVGLLDGEEGFAEGREDETSENYAWGGLLFRRTKSKHKRTVKFVALEDNPTTFRLVNPGSTRTTTAGVRTGTVKVPTIEKFLVGFELRDGAKTKRRYGVAEVSEIGEIKESETEPTVYEITVVIFPDEEGVLFHTVETDPA